MLSQAVMIRSIVARKGCCSRAAFCCSALPDVSFIEQWCILPKTSRSQVVFHGNNSQEMRNNRSKWALMFIACKCSRSSHPSTTKWEIKLARAASETIWALLHRLLRFFLSFFLQVKKIGVFGLGAKKQSQSRERKHNWDDVARNNMRRCGCKTTKEGWTADMRRRCTTPLSRR